MSALRHPACLVTVDDVVTPAMEWHTNHSTDAIGQATLVLPLPLPEHVVDNATLHIQTTVDAPPGWTGSTTVTHDGVPLTHDGAELGHGLDLDGVVLRTVFAGSIRADDRTFDEGGKWATIKADGWLHLMEFPNNVDVAYAGGAGTSPALLVGAAHHLGDNTISNYAVPVAEGTSYDATWTPAVDSDFIRLTGKLHSTNNDLGDITNLRMTHFDRVEIRQGGSRRGYGVFQVATEIPGADFDVVEEFGDVGGVWEDFDLTISARLTVAGGTATARFISGYPPGGGRGDHEFQQVRRSTAAKMTARSIIRGLFKKRGFGGASGLNYVVDEIVPISGIENVIKLGGNGFVDNGQTRIAAGQSFFAFVKRIANLFGYRVYDSPDGICRVRAVRGTPSPSATVSATFTEGTNILRVKRARDLKPTVNYWRVLGASGADADGVRFQYSSEPDPDAVPDNPNIPDPPGWAAAEISDDLLVSDTLCLYVRHLKEADTMDGSTVYEWEVAPITMLQPGRVVVLNAASVGASGRLWLTGIRHDWSDAGYWMTCTGWTGGGEPLPEAPDPDEDEDDIEPSADLPVQRWRPYSPRVGS